MKRISLVFVLWVTALLVSERLAAATPAERADALVTDFVYESLALSPVSASAAGYHVHENVRLDGLWDDYSADGLAKIRQFNLKLLQRLDALKHAGLDRERLADLDVIRDAVNLKLLELDRIQDFRHNPTQYVELIGNGLYTPFVLNYAPPEQRFQDLIERLRRLPALVAQAKANLVDAPAVWNRVAREENAGNIELIDKTLRAEAPSDLRSAYDEAAAPALQALRELNEILATTLSAKTSDWRLGKDNYQRKCRYTLHTGRTPAQLLAAAEADLALARKEMARLSAPRTVAAALEAMANQHATPATYMDEARRTLAEATEFVKKKDLLTLADNGNLSVIETPVFMRGVYGVGGFNGAPALEPQLGAFYWVTPIPSDWPAARVESKLREYNRYGLQQLTIHEAMPGHYVQAEYANRIEPKARRVLRNIWGNGPYVEGWAVYAQQLMTDEGYLDHDPNLRLSLLKWWLRSVGNTILDVRLQTMGMTEQQALDFMINQTYQEREEAVAKVQRAQLSSCQLDMYYAGATGWDEVRAHYERRHPKDFTLKAFHDRALSEGAVPLETLDRLLH
ncbi:MAG TPA: DUF885 domain-containing protein [Steroidobacteraceae bacterium]|nr:DUF885 domain-containing protein [Steroidobacteraceae bacterium]